MKGPQLRDIRTALPLDLEKSFFPGILRLSAAAALAKDGERIQSLSKWLFVSRARSGVARIMHANNAIAQAALQKRAGWQGMAAACA